jgi:hypothetical protein
MSPETSAYFKEYFPDFENFIKKIAEDFDIFTNIIIYKKFEKAVKGEVRNMKNAIIGLFNIKATQEILDKQEVKSLI